MGSYLEKISGRSCQAVADRYGILQRVRFVVSETLAGPTVREVYTDASSCGYHFAPDQAYLVSTRRDGPRYRTGACSGTREVESDDAVEDLKALRAWESGKPLPPRIYGQIGSTYMRTDTIVRLIDDREERSVRPGADGRFSFDGLQRTVYRLQVEDVRGKAERVIDLKRLSCWEATPLFRDVWRILGSPVLVDSS